MLAVLCLGGSAMAAPVGRVPERLLVKPKHGVAEAALQAVFASHGAQQVDAIKQIDVRILHVPEERFARVLRALSNNPNIEFAEPDVVLAPDMVPNDPWYPNEWHLPNISAPQAWDITTGRTNVIVAILDTGVDQVTQPDLTN